MKLDQDFGVAYSGARGRATWRGRTALARTAALNLHVTTAASPSHIAPYPSPRPQACCATAPAACARCGPATRSRCPRRRASGLLACPPPRLRPGLTAWSASTSGSKRRPRMMEGLRARRRPTANRPQLRALGWSLRRCRCRRRAWSRWALSWSRCCFPRRRKCVASERRAGVGGSGCMEGGASHACCLVERACARFGVLSPRPVPSIPCPVDPSSRSLGCPRSGWAAWCAWTLSAARCCACALAWQAGTRNRWASNKRRGRAGGTSGG